MAARNNSKYIQTEYGLFPTSYFFSSGVSNEDGSKRISAEKIKRMIINLLETEGNLSDSDLTKRLNEEGIKIARRTVAKYRAQTGIKNSYYR